MLEFKVQLDYATNKWQVVDPRGSYRACDLEKVPETIAGMLEDFAGYLSRHVKKKPPLPTGTAEAVTVLTGLQDR